MFEFIFSRVFFITYEFNDPQIRCFPGAGRNVFSPTRVDDALFIIVDIVTNESDRCERCVCNPLRRELDCCRSCSCILKSKHYVTPPSGSEGGFEHLSVEEPFIAFTR